MQPDILFLLCDTARADAFRPWGGRLETPTTDRLTREGLTFSRAISQAPWTLPSTASMFSGRLPTEHGITGDCFEWNDGRPTSPAEAVHSYAGRWLPEALRERGYRTWGASCNTWISAWGGFDRGFEEFLDLRDRTRLPKGRLGTVLRRGRRMYGRVDRGGRQAVQAFARRLNQAGRDPLFGFVNLMETHAPYDPPRPYYPFSFWKRAKTRRLSGGTAKARRFLSYNARVAEPPPDYVRTIRDLYYHSARYEDWLLGRFLGIVRARDRPTIVVVVADHGENLGENGLFNHNSSLGETLLHVPLVLWGYRLELPSGKVEEPVTLLWLADWLRVAAEGVVGSPPRGGDVVSEYESTVRHNGIPADIRGILEGGDPSRVPPLVFRPGMAVRKGSLKYAAVEDGREAAYDLERDPEERHDLLPERPEIAQEFAAAKDEWRRRRSAQPRYAAGDTAEGEIAEHLRMLGYID